MAATDARASKDPRAGVDADTRPPLDDDEGWREGRVSFPLRVGVTGHRDLLEPDELAQQVRRHLVAIRDQFPSTDETRVRLTILSSLAEGADRLVVSEALGLEGDEVEVQAVLPLAVDDYRRDFTDPTPGGSSTRCWPGRRRRHRRRRCPIATRPTSAPDAGSSTTATCSSSSGMDTSRRAAEAPPRSPTTRAAGGSRCWSSPRGASAHPHAPPREHRWQADLSRELGAAAEAYKRVSDFNAGSLQDKGRRRQLQSLEGRLEQAADGTAIQWLYRNVAEWALPRLTRADVLAIHYQRVYYRLGETLFGLAALAVTAVAAQSEAGWSELVDLIEVACMLGLLVMVWTGRRVHVHERWLGYRSLAEAFRSSLFLQLTGTDVRTDVGTVELGTQEEPWFQRAFSQSWKQRPPVSHPESNVADLRRFLIDAWIDDQIAYHRSSVARFARSRRRLTRTILLLFTLTVVIGVLHSFSLVPGDRWTHWFVFLAIALPGFGAALTGIRDQRQYRLHEDRSRRTASRLQVLRRTMELQTTVAAVQKLAAQVQTVIEAENLDWSGVIEFQDLEMVI